MPRKTWRQTRQAEGASATRSREALAEGCSSVALIPMFIIGGIGALVALVALMLGIDVLARWMAGLLTTPPLPAIIGAGMIALAGWGLLRGATGHAHPGTSRRDMIIAAVTLIVVAVIGMAVVFAAIAPHAQGGPRF